MGERTIKIEPFNLLDFLEFEMDKHVNEHVRVRFKGHITIEENEKYANSHLKDKNVTISIFDEDGTEMLFFEGLIQDYQVELANDIHLLTITCISNTILMDRKKTIRTFQSHELTYGEVADSIASSNEKYGIIVPAHSQDQIGTMLVQYEETDWDFLIRLASNLKTVVVPNSTLNYAAVYLGPRYKLTDNYSELQVASYIVRREVEAYQNNVHNGVSDIWEESEIYYEVQSRGVFDLCAPVLFLGKKLLVYGVHTKLQGAQLVHTYTLKEYHGFISRRIYCQKLIGASLTGVVKEANADQIRIEIDTDIQQKEYKWFPYATVYSSPDGTGWYFMPEIADRVKLHFPDEDEENAFVISASHISHDLRKNPDSKTITTKYGKKVIFSPTSIQISNGAGSSILLDDSQGIEIDTNREVKITSQEDMYLNARGKITIEGRKGVVIKQNNSALHIDENIQMTSGHVRIR